MAAKSIHKPEYRELLRRLRGLRQAAGLSQTDLAALLGRSQSTISDIERGARRLDTLEVREYCLACGQDPARFMKRFEQAIARWPIP